MDIKIADEIFEALKYYNKKIGSPYGNVVVPYPTTKPTYPYCVFDEINNIENPQSRSDFDRVSTIGYKLEIYAKTKGCIDNRTIARDIAQKLNSFLTRNVGLRQVGFVPVPQVNQSSIYQITITYIGKLHENRKTIY